jgi:hypothetical protein
MIVEVRKYTIKPGLRAKFIEFFETRAVPAQREIEMEIMGPLLDIENPDVFAWLRGFPSLEECDQMKTAFYDGDLWTKELEAITLKVLRIVAGRSSKNQSLSETEPRSERSFAPCWEQNNPRPFVEPRPAEREETIQDRSAESSREMMAARAPIETGQTQRSPPALQQCDVNS